ncbi:MAG TPA: GatB/YqeY domain-containing protein, partial [Cycloclasticus sp.]|nr:GatB/YqeY domain-containing protein [Cycloclasticus sp.]
MSESANALSLRIREDMKLAMKAKEKEKLGVIRLMLAAIKQREVDERIELDDAQVLQLLDKMVKQRRDSIEAFDKANRDDLSVI